MSDIPADVSTDILSRLPVKSLLRFRCISKSWCALIDSPNFIHMHLSRSMERNSNLSLILTDCMHIYSVDFDSFHTAVKLDHPFILPAVTEVMGSCNGLHLLFNAEKGLAIWNPFTRECRKLPDSPILSPNYTGCRKSEKYGFGYDAVNDDYKVLRIVQFSRKNVEFNASRNEAKVYSLKSNSWRRTQNFPYCLQFTQFGGVLAGGALHWVVKQGHEPEKDRLIVGFDIGTEKCRVVPQPDYPDKSFYMSVETLKGCLCMSHCYNDGFVDVWMMKDYGVKESWTRLLSVMPPSGQSFQHLRPLAYSKNGNEILLSHNNDMLLWYDLTRKTIKEFRVRDVPPVFFAEICVGSLVQLNGYGRIDLKRQPGKREKEGNENKKEEGLFSFKRIQTGAISK